MNSTVKTYAALFVIFLVLGAVLFFIVSIPPSEEPPKGPIEIGAGPSPEATLNKTEVDIDIPSRSLDVLVTFRFNETREYFIYVLLPYKVVDTSAYAVYRGGFYPHEIPPSKQDIGNFSTHHWFNATTGSSILNASLDINPTFPWHFGDADMKDELTLAVTIKIENSLIAIAYPLGASQSLVLTFFGEHTGIISNEMYVFMEPLSQLTLGQPFTVHVRLPASTYFSDGQPSPIQYYIKQDDRWLMFSMDFIEGRYAQTLYSTFTNPTGQSLKEILVFVAGGSVALSISFAVEAVINRDEKKKANPSKIGRSVGTAKSLKKGAGKTVDLLKIQIYADHGHTVLASQLSFLFAYFIGLAVLFYTVLYQDLGPSPFTTWVIGLTATAVSTIGFLYYIMWNYQQDVKAMSRMIEAVKAGKPLPELEKLSRKSVP